MVRATKDIHRLVSMDDSGCNKLESKWHRLLCSEMSQTNPILVGVDEVGNGAIYGPICVAAVSVFSGWHLAAIKDSKKISNADTRSFLSKEIRHNTVWTMASLPSQAIDQFGAGPALEYLQSQVIENHVERIRKSYQSHPVKVILDGQGDNQSFATHSIERMAKADSLIFEVSCASILAKVLVDEWIIGQVKSDPALGRYHLDKNKGYGTEAHKEAIRRHGLTPHHRKGACRTFLTEK